MEHKTLEAWFVLAAVLLVILSAGWLSRPSQKNSVFDGGDCACLELDSSPA